MLMKGVFVSLSLHSDCWLHSFYVAAVLSAASSDMHDQWTLKNLTEDGKHSALTYSLPSMYSPLDSFPGP